MVSKAREYLGVSEADGSHRKIIDLYNSLSPLPRGYAVSYTDPWCAAFVSAVMLSLGLEDIAPAECSCGVMLSRYRALGRYREDRSAAPQTGDIVFYDWEGDGTSDHVGIAEAVSGGVITVIEGNISDRVGERKIAVGDERICGCGLPDYAAAAQDGNSAEETEENQPLPVPAFGDKGELVRAMQSLLIVRGCALPQYGADGEYGEETRAALEEFGAARLWERLIGIE